MVHAVLSLIVLVVVGAVALTSRQTAPPTIAEFAPRAVAQINEASGDAAGAGAGPLAETSTPEQDALADKVAGAAVDVARVRKCVGDPPRQIEDPQSPPCVPYWSGDNGGATSHGVSRDEIRVAEYGFPAPRELVAFLNRRFELYGREIRLVTRPLPGNDPAGQRAAARATYEEDQAFAAVGVGGDYRNSEYYDELARLGVVGINGWGPYAPEAFLAARRPYVWTYSMANDRIFATAGDWYCARFAGRNAVHAGDPLLQASRRKPGIILTDKGSEGTTAEPLNAQLASCGERTDDVIESSLNYTTDCLLTGPSPAYVAFIENAMLQMKTEGVTTLGFLGNYGCLGPAMRAATNQGYFPEWLLTNYGQNDLAIYVRLFGAREQMDSIMMLSAHPMERPAYDHPSEWALKEGGGAQGGPGPGGPSWILDGHYRGLLLLASGLQMAGPHLTPLTFERGLQAARFPNPPHRIMAGAVGFGGAARSQRDHSMTDDVTETWWGSTATSPYPQDGPGSYCYVDGGARRRIGTFPTDDPFFQGICHNGTS